MERNIEESNQYNIILSNIEKKNTDSNESINELKDIITKIKDSNQNKKEMIIILIQKIIDSFNLAIKQELNIDNRMNFFQYKKKILNDKQSGYI